MKRLFIFLSIIIIIQSCTNNQSLNVMSFNIRYDNPNDAPNHWENRKELVANVFEEKNIQLAGIQEVLKHQLDFLVDQLPQYHFYGVGRDDGQDKGEFCPVAFLKSRFDLVDKNTFWLSETPKKPGTLSWDTVCNRVCSYVKLKDKKNDKILYFFNTHFSHVSDEARRQSADILLTKIKEIAGDTKVILTGDFNLTRDTEAYQKLTNHSNIKLTDAYSLIPDVITETTHTYNGFGQGDNRPIIDYIFLSPTIEVNQLEIFYKKNNNIYVSDHYPVIAKINF